ncbi:MAG: hypothetical protein MUF65_11270, partial [Rubritepida sp.]|nr:hypothetical protein [Rubritepida sp.]
SMGQVERDAEASSCVAQSVLKSSNALSGETDMLWAQIEAFVEHVATGDSRAYHRSACDATITMRPQAMLRCGRSASAAAG